jgi:hypothetical protein
VPIFGPFGSSPFAAVDRELAEDHFATDRHRIAQSRVSPTERRIDPTLGRGLGAPYARSAGAQRSQEGPAVVTDRLPELLDAKALQAELGVTRAAAEGVMRNLPTVQIEGLRKVYVRRSDVARYLESRTFAKDEVPA